MKTMNAVHIIGVDHGYGNIKTANHCFKTGILGYDSEPLFTGDMLTHGGRYYLIGEGHKEFIAEKIKDEDYYLLTLVAIAKELKDAELTEANIVLAAGLPLTWTSGQKKEFAAYLGKNKEVDFNYKKVDYGRSEFDRQMPGAGLSYTITSRELVLQVPHPTASTAGPLRALPLTPR